MDKCVYSILSIYSSHNVIYDSQRSWIARIWNGDSPRRATRRGREYKQWQENLETIVPLVLFLVSCKVTRKKLMSSKGGKVLILH